jgi:hypothetical protein
MFLHHLSSISSSNSCLSILTKHPPVPPFFQIGVAEANFKSEKFPLGDTIPEKLLIYVFKN